MCLERWTFNKCCNGALLTLMRVVEARSARTRAKTLLYCLHSPYVTIRTHQTI